MDPFLVLVLMALALAIGFCVRGIALEGLPERLVDHRK